MVIENLFPEQPLVQEMTHTFLGRDGAVLSRMEPVLREHGMHLVVNEQLSMNFVCLPQYLPELLLGHLVTEGYLHSAQTVEALHIDASGLEATVTLNALPQPQPMQPVRPIPWKNEWIFALADRFAQGMPVHEQTFATHSCFLARGEELLFQCEDIGRHNAVDKCVGYALCNGIALEECLLYCSGRVPIDMASKAIRSGIPVFASKGSPTADAVELARRYDLTLLCAARRDRMKLFSAPKY